MVIDKVNHGLLSFHSNKKRALSLVPSSFPHPTSARRQSPFQRLGFYINPHSHSASENTNIQSPTENIYIAIAFKTFYKGCLLKCKYCNFLWHFIYNNFCGTWYINISWGPSATFHEVTKCEYWWLSVNIKITSLLIGDLYEHLVNIGIYLSNSVFISEYPRL